MKLPPSGCVVQISPFPADGSDLILWFVPDVVLATNRESLARIRIRPPAVPLELSTPDVALVVMRRTVVPVFAIVTRGASKVMVPPIPCDP